MPPYQDEAHELDSLEHPGTAAMEEEETALRSGDCTTDEALGRNDRDIHQERLNRMTVRKLDFVLLPFLATLFLLNSLDKSNIGNAETAGFTHDAGLSARDLNVALAFFFAFFVALQPVGAAFGRKYGMARWVPSCMSLWGLCTILHIWVRRRWQLICLRIAIASLEAGFYPTTVSYLSMFYTRYEFAVRLGFFYGQSAVAGVLGGVLSWAVFRNFPEQVPGSQQQTPDSVDAISHTRQWKSWEVLFLAEGCMTVIIALIGFFWLPHGVDTAWFFAIPEKEWAEQRIRLDRGNDAPSQKRMAYGCHSSSEVSEGDLPPALTGDDDDDDIGEAHQHLLGDPASFRHRRSSAVSMISFAADSGLSRYDILSAVLNYKIWHLLICNILSAIPATAFGVFLPLVIKQLSPSLNLSAAASNLLAAPPFAFGAVVLFIFTRWSDRRHQRLVPILCGLGLLLVGLTITVLVGTYNHVLRYMGLCVLLSGSFIASPLTVAWLTDNTPEPGKRAILLGINGWGNLAGVFSALLFAPEDEASGYIRPFVVTLICVLASFAGFIAFWMLLARENKWRDDITSAWTEDEREREELLGDAPIWRPSTVDMLWKSSGLEVLARSLGWEDVRRGDEKMTFRYGL